MNNKQEREAFKKHYGALFDLTEIPGAWGNPRFFHESVEAIWYGWRDRAALQSQDLGYSPRKIGAELFRGGFGISDIRGAVRSDIDMNEALSGYIEAKKTQEETRLTSKDIDKALVGIRPDNHPVAYRVLSDLKSAIDQARRVEGDGE